MSLLVLIAVSAFHFCDAFPSRRQRFEVNLLDFNPSLVRQDGPLGMDELNMLHADAVKFGQGVTNLWFTAIDAKTLDSLITEMNEMNRWFAKVVKYWDDFTSGGDGSTVLEQNGKGIKKLQDKGDAGEGGAEGATEGPGADAEEEGAGDDAAAADAEGTDGADAEEGADGAAAADGEEGAETEDAAAADGAEEDAAAADAEGAADAEEGADDAAAKDAADAAADGEDAAAADAAGDDAAAADTGDAAAKETPAARRRRMRRRNRRV